MSDVTIRKRASALGAEVVGLDLREELTEDVVRRLRAAWLEHIVLVFRGQDLTHEQHIAFSRRFGALDDHDSIPKFRHPDHAEILLVTNFENTGKRLAVGRQWHSDLSTTTRPAMGSLLYCQEAPSAGGDTMFANMYRAWETLTPAFRSMLEGRFALHDMTVAKETRSRRSAEELADIRRRNPPVLQPVARVHDETGRPALYVAEMTSMVLEGMTEEESAPILRFLYEHSVVPENVYRHRWQPGDLLMWDNRCAIHIALGDYGDDERRMMYRTTLLGAPSGRLAEAA
ncbi:TauD/TfdA family dioxygenase [Azospirillum sp. RWY-5-1]|uniref:TauD/TfdA family dioxygenase n=1 Tax=Azospirillum oleiclasticum TaxID=2735135 RepID=A0ABX2TIC6_9PROT|nr:TauD/TfdA family dioxygenase [Azospirillum oleiclasticum]NYZ16547.1 TauD/TfdA family dioxygenase [Azospirillum oleiclasticum]NYZ23983.1 TauD/TfdA family dioxygenase [Azospirillum oleiclasticum]